MSNPFRPTYRELNDAEQQQLLNIKEKASELLEEIEKNPHQEGARERALAKTKLEESVMWAVKSITG